MTSMGFEILSQKRQTFRLQRNLGDAFSDVLKHLFARHSAKELAKELGVDPVTSRNAQKGVAGGAAITRSLHHRQAHHDDHWDLWDALGALLFGETRDQYDERKLAALIEKTNEIRQINEERRRRRSALEARAVAALALEDRREAG